MTYTRLHEYTIVNEPTMPHAQPVGRPYKTKTGALNYLHREWVGTMAPGNACWEIAAVKQPDDMWVPFIRSAFPITRGANR